MSSDNLVLAFDTVGPVIGVGAWDGTRGAVRSQRVTRGAEAFLLDFAKEVLAELGANFTDVTLVAVAKGPGAFTGLRVGLATATGLSISLGVPLWGGMSLASRAERVQTSLPVLSLLDARKGKVYGWWRGKPESTAVDVPPEEILSNLPEAWIATGEGAEVYRDLVETAGGQIADDPTAPAVVELAQLALGAHLRGEDGSAAPLYIRPPDAKIPTRRGLK